MPAGWPLESLVTEIDRELNPNTGCECSQQEIVRRICHTFKLTPPITGEKIRLFLETCDIYHEVAPSIGHTTYICNRPLSRWEIHTRPCFTYEWSREVWHEVWEILFWRCYHRIPWWKDWAKRNGYDNPHDKADEFAYLMLLSSQSVPAQAKKRYYDVYEVANYYTVPTNLAFRALQSYTRFSHPILMVVLRLDVPPPVQRQVSLEDGLFANDGVPADGCYAKIYHKGNKPGSRQKAIENLTNPERLQELRAVEMSFQTLSKHFRHDKILHIDASDPIYRYSRQPDARGWTVSHLFGVDSAAEVSVITRQSPRCKDEIFLQVVPTECEGDFLPDDNQALRLPDAAIRTVELEWRKAARSIKNRPRVSV